MKEIRCCVCQKYLGVIRDAKLHKDIDFICKECKNKYINTTDSKDEYFLKELNKILWDK